MRGAFLGLVAAITLAACGGDDSACETWGEEVCARACECTDDDTCSFTAGGVSLGFDDESDCRAFFSTSLACHDGGDPDFDYEGCTAELDQTMCIDDGAAGSAQLPDCAG